MAPHNNLFFIKPCFSYLGHKEAIKRQNSPTKGWKLEFENKDLRYTAISRSKGVSSPCFHLSNGGYAAPGSSLDPHRVDRSGRAEPGGVTLCTGPVSAVAHSHSDAKMR